MIIQARDQNEKLCNILFLFFVAKDEFLVHRN